MQPASLAFTIYKGVTFGPVLITCTDSEGAPVDLTGWTAYATARLLAPGWPGEIDLAPSITNAAAGQITLGMTDDQTQALTTGKFGYDLVLQNPDGERLGPFLAGTISVFTLNTRPA